jgi:hypothetical protein
MGPRIVLFTICLLLQASQLQAGVRRLAIVLGHNIGTSNEAVLKYAQRDAQRLADVLGELGRFDQIIVKQGINASDLALELEGVKQKIAKWKQSGEQVFLLFFYSGHADGRNLHLGGSHFSGEELFQRLSDVGADLRLVILDSCQSGDWTREKGLVARAPVSVELLDEIKTTGQVIIASTGKGESAQESESLQGSFFSSHFVSGLRGTADVNGDGEIGLREAYAYAYDRTIHSTVMSQAGIQHPTFSMKLSGEKDLPLTWPGGNKTFLSFRARTPGAFLVLTHKEDTVVAEVPTQAKHSRRIGLTPGDYIVKKRSSDGLKVAQVQLKEGTDVVLDESQMQPVPYAVLAKKGGVLPGWWTLGAGTATKLLDVNTIYQVDFGYVIDLEWLSIWPELGFSIGTDSEGRLGDEKRITLLAASLNIGIVRLIRFNRWNLVYGLQAIAPLYYQMVEGQDARVSMAMGLDGLFGVNWWITNKVGFLIRVQAGARWLKLEADPWREYGQGWKTRANASFRLGLLMRF